MYNCNKIETIRIKLLQMATASLAAHNNNKHTHIYRKGKWQMAKPLTNTERTWQPKYKMALGCIQKGLSGIDKSFKNFHTFVVSSSLLAVATLLSPSLSPLLVRALCHFLTLRPVIYVDLCRVLSLWLAPLLPLTYVLAP